MRENQATSKLQNVAAEGGDEETEPLLLEQRLVAMGAGIRKAGTLEAVTGDKNRKERDKNLEHCTFREQTHAHSPLYFRKPKLPYFQPT